MPKTILITGASSGFGQACAERFAENGNTLLLLARREQRLKSLRDSLSQNCTIELYPVDITDSQELETRLEHITHDYPHIDILINNAGLALGLDPAYEADMNDWETMINTNITGLVKITRRILPNMVKENTGHIVNIGSTAGNWPYPGGNVYGATKAFVKNFSQQLRADLTGKPIRVTNIEPGLSQTEFSEVRFKKDKEKAESVYQGTQPLTAADIAESIYWVTQLPSHVNINHLEMMPTCQSWAPLSIDRQMLEDR